MTQLSQSPFVGHVSVPAGHDVELTVQSALQLPALGPEALPARHSPLAPHQPHPREAAAVQLSQSAWAQGSVTSVQVPPSQESPVVQTLPSQQGWSASPQSLATSQVPPVHTLPSVQAAGGRQQA